MACSRVNFTFIFTATHTSCWPTLACRGPSSASWQGDYATIMRFRGSSATGTAWKCASSCGVFRTTEPQRITGVMSGGFWAPHIQEDGLDTDGRLHGLFSWRIELLWFLLCGGTWSSTYPQPSGLSRISRQDFRQLWQKVFGNVSRRVREYAVRRTAVCLGMDGNRFENLLLMRRARVFRRVRKVSKSDY